MILENKIIYSPSVNSTELLRSLSLHDVDSFNVRIFSFNELLEAINSRLGFPIRGSLFSQKEIEENVLSFFTKKVDLKRTSFQDIQHFLNTSNNLRMHIKDSNEKDVFNSIAKNNEEVKSLRLLKQFLDSYFESLGDSIDLIMFAHKIIDYVEQNNIKVFKEIYCLEEDNLLPLENKLLKAISERVVRTTVLSLFDIQTNKKEIKSIMPRYGIRNEVSHVINDIIKNKYPLDECQIVLINKSEYTNELFKLMNNFNINMTFECGLPINLSDAYKLYSSLLKLGNNHFYDVNGYLNLFSSESLDLDKLGIKDPIQTAQLLGRMKICFDKDINDEYISKFDDIKINHPEEFELILEKIDRNIAYNKDEILNEMYYVAEEFSKGIAYIIKQYTKHNIGDEDFYNEAVEYIVSTIEYANDEKFPAEIKDSYLKTIDSKYIHKSLFKDDAIHVTTISKALSSIRKHTYIVGLNSAYYPGSLTEDFLFSDNLYEELCGIKDITETSLNKKNEYLRKVIETCLYVSEDLSLSYNSQEIKEVRELNPCSVLLEYAEKFFKGDAEALKKLKEKCSYYDDGLSKLDKISRIAIDNNVINEVKLDVEQSRSNGINDKGNKYIDESYSPSTLPKFLKCPLRFYLDNIAGIDDKIEYDPLRPIGGGRFGDLLHYVMEHFVKDAPDATLEEIKKYAIDLYDMYTSIDRSISDDDLEKLPFLYSVEVTYNYLKNNFGLKTGKTELKIGYKEEKNLAEIGQIHFKGSIDLVIQDKKGDYVVLDYKTGSNIEHEPNDVDTCIQGLIYAQLYEKVYGQPISKLVFYYTRRNKPVIFENPCSKEAKKALLERIGLFKNALINLDFPAASKEKQEEACKYCKYANICHKEEVKEDGE